MYKYTAIIGASRSEPYINHTYEKIAVLMYVCMRVCMYMCMCVYVAIRRPRVAHTHIMAVIHLSEMDNKMYTVKRACVIIRIFMTIE